MVRIAVSPRLHGMTRHRPLPSIPELVPQRLGPIRRLAGPSPRSPLLSLIFCLLFVPPAVTGCSGDVGPTEESETAASDPADAPPEDIPADELLREVEAGASSEGGEPAVDEAAGEGAPEVVSSPLEEAEIFLVEVETGGEGAFGCGDRLRGVRVPVSDAAGEGVPGNVGAAVRALLAAEGGPGTPRRLYNALARSTLSVEAVEEVLAEEGIYRVRLTGELSPGGVCDHPRIVEQLRATAEAVEGVGEAEIWLGGRPVEQVLAQRH